MRNSPAYSQISNYQSNKGHSERSERHLSPQSNLSKVDSPTLVYGFNKSNTTKKREFSLLDFIISINDENFDQKMIKLKSSIKSSVDACNFTNSWETLFSDDRLQKSKLLKVANYLIKEGLDNEFPLLRVNRNILTKVFIEFNEKKDFKQEFKEFITLLEDNNLVSIEDLNFYLQEINYENIHHYPPTEKKDVVDFFNSFNKNISYESLSSLIERLNTSITILDEVNELIQALSTEEKNNTNSNGVH